MVSGGSQYFTIPLSPPYSSRVTIVAFLVDMEMPWNWFSSRCMHGIFVTFSGGYGGGDGLVVFGCMGGT